MEAVETIEIKALIVSKSTYLLIKWPQLISRATCCDQIFVTSRIFRISTFPKSICAKTFFGRGNSFSPYISF